MSIYNSDSNGRREAYLDSVVRERDEAVKKTLRLVSILENCVGLDVQKELERQAALTQFRC